MTVNKNMNKASIIEAMTEKGFVFSEQLTKAELVKLYEKQMKEFNLNEEDENMNNEDLNVQAEEVEQGAIEGETFEEAHEEIEAAAEETEVTQEASEAPAEEDTTETLEDADAEPADSMTDEEIEQVQKDNVVEEAPKPNKRRVGKEVEHFVNGELVTTYPSIKACATDLKEKKGIKHMPFTPIMKSIRQGIDWEENSFKFASIDAEPLAEEKKSEDVKEASEVPTEDKDEIVEVPTEELANEDEKTEVEA